MVQKIKVGLVDDDIRTTRNISDLLSFTKELEIVLIAHSGKEFITKNEGDSRN